jgi:hypothetical protein
MFAEVAEHEKNCKHGKTCSTSNLKSGPVATRTEIEPPQLAKDIPVAGTGNFRCPHCSQIVLSVLGATARTWRVDGCAGKGGTQCKKVSIEMVEEREATQVAKAAGDAKAAKDAQAAAAAIMPLSLYAG